MTNYNADPISTLEKKLLLVLSLPTLLFFLWPFAAEALRESTVKKPVSISFAVDDPMPRVPAGLHLITVPIFLSLIRPRKFLVVTVLTLLYAGLLLLSFYVRVDGESFFGGPIPGDPHFFLELYLKTWIWDYVAAAFLVIMLPWLFSILYRLRGSRTVRR